MKDLLVLFAHLLATFAKLISPGGTKAVVAENLLLKQQLLIINRSQQRAPNPTTANRFIFGLGALFLTRNRITKVSVIIRPSTLLKFHQYLFRR
ncbi:MAG: helix-turn-helix domain-containing protein, partial [Gammaproteobacteria bacterium]|nr:helix-turn-helix domain-containing protein [Gammaproteobacteria bacterium]